MLGSYIKTSGRSILRNKLFSAINIGGMSISMTVGLLMIVFLNDLHSYDQFHEKSDRIYRVYNTYKNVNWNADVATTSVKAAQKIRETISGIEDVVVLNRNFTMDAAYDEKVIPLQGFSASNSFFTVFTFPLLQGDPATALKDPYTVVFTETAARKLFGDDDPIGKTVKCQLGDFMVTGIMKDVPEFSHMEFDVLISYATTEAGRKKDANHGWDEIWGTYVYILLPPDGDPKTLQTNLDRLSESENKNLQNASVNLFIQPLTNVVLGKDMTNGIGAGMPSLVVWIIGGLAVVVICSACFNYTNLSIARALRRSREIGIRKVVGARKGHVFMQFIVEAVIISLLALVLSVGLFFLLRDQFLAIAPELERMVNLRLSYEVIIYFILLAIITGIIAGFLPSLLFSGIKAIQVLKDALLSEFSGTSLCGRL